jgi:RNA polymerase sigma-70 factor (ECF subfamily)
LSPARSHIDEEEFISFLEKLKAGHERSWYQLDFVLKRIVCKWLNRKGIPVDDAVEIYNAVFSIFYEKIQGTKFETFKNLKSYVFSIAENKVKEFYRNRAKHRRTESADNEHYSKYIISISNATQVKYEEQIFQVEHCFKLLNQKERAILNFVYKDGKSLKEVAEVLSIGESNARVIKHRALEKIRKKIVENRNIGLK